MSAANGKKSHSLESLGHGSILYLIGQLVLIGATFGSRVLVVRSLGTTNYGDIALGIATISVIIPLVSIGIPYGVARQIAHSKNLTERYNLMVVALEVVVPLAVFAGVALFLVAPMMANLVADPDLTAVLQFFAAYMAINIVSGTFGALNQGEEDMLPLSLFNMVVTPILLLAFLVIFFQFGASLMTAITAYVLSSAGGLIGLAVYTFRVRWGKIHQALLDRTPKYSRRLLGDLVLFSAPLTMMGVAAVVTGNVDVLVLGFAGHFSSPSAGVSTVGMYSAVITVARLLTLGVGSFAAIMLPVAARLHRNENTEELSKSYATMTKWLLALFIPLYTLFLIFPSPTILLIYGKNTGSFALAPDILRIAATGAIITVLIGPSQSVLTGLGRLRLLFLDTLAAAAIDLVGSLLLVPPFGVYGAAIAFSASTIALPLFAVLQTGLLAGIHPFQRPVLLPLGVYSVVAAALLGVPTLVLGWTPGPLSLVILFFVLLSLYFGIVLLTRSTESEDLYLLGVFERYLGREITFLHRVVLHFERRSSLAEPKVYERE